ncbi:MAG: YfcE family phosphodiesterase [Promethearchaeota archaeon]
MNPVKILVISDTHFVRKTQKLPEQILSHFQEVNYIVHAGDYTHISLVNFLESTGKFYGVAGNMDPLRIKEKLPDINHFKIGDILIGIIHGWGAPEGIVERIHLICKEKGFDIVLFGHTHNHLKRILEGVQYFNPGSPVDKMFAKENTFLILNVESKENVQANFIRIK